MKTISSATAVIARNSSFTFKGKAVDVKEVGRRLGVRYVLEGSVRKAAGKVRITGQLIDAITGAHICLLRSHENKLLPGHSYFWALEKAVSSTSPIGCHVRPSN